MRNNKNLTIYFAIEMSKMNDVRVINYNNCIRIEEN